MLAKFFCFTFLLNLWLVASSHGALVFQIGSFDNNHTEFEQEGGSYNDDQFYVHAGDYRSISGSSSLGKLVTQPERISDGADAAAWATSLEGFRRALTNSLPKQDIFFMLSAEDIAAGALEFSIRFNQMGSGSSHNLEFRLNHEVFGTLSNITAATDRLYYTLSLPTHQFSEGANVISLWRTGGSPASTWIAIDAVSLHSVPEPHRALLLLIGVSVLMSRRKR